MLHPFLSAQVRSGWPHLAGGSPAGAAHWLVGWLAAAGHEASRKLGGGKIVGHPTRWGRVIFLP